MSTPNRVVEIWTWYGAVTLVVILRFIYRSISLKGWKNLKIEDYVMVLTFGFYTNLIVWVHIQAQHPFTNILPPSGMDGLTQADIADRVYGSKIAIVLEHSMILTQWGCKWCMCLLYFHMTEGLREQTFVKFLIGYVALGWALIEIFALGVWCRPFSNYYTVGYDVPFQCQVPMNHLIMSYVFNISADLLMLCVPLPLFIRSRFPWRQKLILCCLYGLGVFVVIAATLNRLYSWAFPTSILWIFWYVREASTAVIVTNASNCYALLRRIFNPRVSNNQRDPSISSSALPVASGEHQIYRNMRHTNSRNSVDRIAET